MFVKIENKGKPGNNFTLRRFFNVVCFLMLTSGYAEEITPQAVLSASTLVNLTNKAPVPTTNGMAKITGRNFGWIVNDKIPAGNYYLEWKIQSGTDHGMEFLDKHEPFIYLNGKPLLFDYAKGIQRENDSYVSQIQSEGAVPLKPGDHFYIAKALLGGKTGDLKLYIKPVKKGLIRTRGFVKRLHQGETELNYKLISQKNNNINSEATIKNITNQVQEYNISFDAKDYWQTKVKEENKTFSIAPYQSKKVAFSFPVNDSFRYTTTVTAAIKNGVQYRKTLDIEHDIENKWRSYKWLNNSWKYYKVQAGWDSPLPPQNSKASALTLPGMFYYYKDNTMLFKKQFSLDSSFANKKVNLHFSGNGDEVQIWLNEQLILKKQKTKHTPFQIDITDSVNLKGLNSLALVIYPTSRLPLRDVFITAQPKQEIKNVLIDSSFRKKNVSLRITTNKADGMNIFGEISYQGKSVLQIPLFKIKTPTQTKVIPWEKPVLWEIENPRLLKLSLTLTNDAGAIMDRKDIRFGFREMLVDGNNVYVNGVVRRFRGVAMNGSYDHNMAKPLNLRERIRLRKKLGINYLRHVYEGETYASIADEEGIVMTQGVISVGHQHATAEVLQDDKMWADKDYFSKKIVLSLYNHPSIVEWYISNEFSESKKGDSMILATKRLVAARDFLRKIDPIRLMGNGCDLDLRGAKNFYSTHYPIDIRALRELSVYTPDVCLWHKPDQSLRKGMMVPAGQITSVANVHTQSPMAWGTKPISVDEFGWNMFYNPPCGYLQIFGDKAISSVWEMKDAHHRINGMFNAGHREAEVFLYVNWDHTENFPYLYVPKVDIYLWDQSNAWYEESKISIPLNIFYEKVAEKPFNLSVVLEGSTSKTTILNSSIPLKPMSVFRKTINFTTPKVSKVEEFKMQYILTSGDEIIATEVVNVKIYPKKINPIKSTQEILIFDPTQKLAKRLEELSLKSRTIVSLDKLNTLPAQTLIIARNALLKASESDITQIENYVNKGGRVLLLQQEKVHGLFNMNTSFKISSIAFKRSFNQPVLQDFTDSDFKYWFKGHVVSKYDYLKPKKRAGISLLDTGSGIGGLEYTPLFKLTTGKGVCYLSQMNITQNYKQAPIADKLFQSLLKVIINFKPEKKTIAIFTKPDSPLENFLNHLNLEIAPKKDLTSCNAIVCDADLLKDVAFKAKMVTYLQGNGTIYFKNINLSNQKDISEVLGTKLNLTQNSFPFIKGRALILERDPVLDGLSQADFFWRRWQEHENTPVSLRKDQDFIYKISDLQGAVKGGESILYPNSLLKIKKGNATVYLDMVLWEKAPPVLKKQTARIAKTILLNLGAKFKNEKTNNLDITKVAFEPISLKGLFNRGMVDKVDNDGKGSWNDQGVQNDTKGFPTGKQTFNNIPFVIGKGVNCIALHSRFRKSDLPKIVRIPINKKVAGLAFLHTSAWTGTRVHGYYIIHYQDGSINQIPLDKGKTYRDFCAAEPNKPFANEGGIKTECAYTYTTKKGTKASLFQTIWTNPNPASKVDYINYKTTDFAVCALFAITALTGDAAIEQKRPGNPQLAKAFNSAGLRQYKSQKYNLAIQSFKMAIDADSDNYPSYLLLGDIYQKQKNYPEAEKILLKLIAITPKDTEAYTKLGSIYELQGKNKEALALYRKSFSIDRNQPWIMKRIENLKKK
jgi:hypothetical protein